ncbi:MAG TPA: hypothetical protein VLE96_04735 [Chlamydiales bacterium]|nr:hypothetical protein [Chlamydiales bacterium]
MSVSSQPISWNVPATTLSTVGVNASDPRVSMDASGDIVAVWVENGVVKANSKLVNGNWGTVASISGSNASLPKVVSDSNGNSTAIWLENGVVKASSKTLAGSWSAAASLSANGASAPVLAIDSAGNVIAGWTTSTSLQTSQKPVGGNWTAKVTINSPGISPSLALGGAGSNTTAAIVWHELVSGVTVIKASTKLFSGSWGTPVVLSNANMNAAYTQVAVDASSDVTAIWYQYTNPAYTNVVLQSSNKPFSAAWTTPVNLSKPGIRNPANLTSGLAFDGYGNTVAVWTNSFDDEIIYVQSSTKGLNNSWSNPVDIASGSLYSHSENLSVSTFGNAVTVFMFYNGLDLIIQSSESDISGFVNDDWSLPINISQGSYNGSPRVVSSVSSNALQVAAVWLSSNLTTNSVQATTGKKSMILPPTNLSVTQSSNNFGVFTEYYNTLTWQASADPNTIGYIIYRNGQYLTQVPANTLQIIDDNRAQNGSVKYGIAAIDRENAHSQIVNISFP